MAARFFVPGGTGNWTSTTNWSTTSGGASGASAPVNGDAVSIDANSGANTLTLDTSARACTSIDFTGSSGFTLVMTNALTCAGSVTLVSGLTISGSGGLTVNATATLSSGGKRWPNALTLSGTSTVTIGGGNDWGSDGLTTLGTSNTGLTINTTTTEKLRMGGGLTKGTQNAAIGGTATLVFDHSSGTKTWTPDAGGTGAINSSVTIDCSGGTLSVATGSLYWGTGTLTYTSGTVSVNSGNTLDLRGSTCTLTTDPVQWAKLTSNNVAGTQTVTLGSDLTATGLATLGLSTRNFIFNQSGGVGDLKLYGGLTVSLTTGFLSGTSLIKLMATQTVAGSGITTGRVDNVIVVDASGGTITWDATLLPYMNWANLTVTAISAFVIDGQTFTLGAGGGTTIAGTPMMRGMVA